MKVYHGQTHHVERRHDVVHDDHAQRVREARERDPGPAWSAFVAALQDGTLTADVREYMRRGMVDDGRIASVEQALRDGHRLLLGYRGVDVGFPNHLVDEFLYQAKMDRSIIKDAEPEVMSPEIARRRLVHYLDTSERAARDGLADALLLRAGAEVMSMGAAAQKEVVSKIKDVLVDKARDAVFKGAGETALAVASAGTAFVKGVLDAVSEAAFAQAEASTLGAFVAATQARLTALFTVWKEERVPALSNSEALAALSTIDSRGSLISQVAMAHWFNLTIEAALLDSRHGTDRVDAVQRVLHGEM